MTGDIVTVEGKPHVITGEQLITAQGADTRDAKGKIVKRGKEFSYCAVMIAPVMEKK